MLDALDHWIATRSIHVGEKNPHRYLLAVDQLLDTGRMPDHADLALFALRQSLLVVAALLGHVQVVVLHDDAEDDITPFVHAVDDILIKVLILRCNVRRGSHLPSSAW